MRDGLRVEAPAGNVDLTPTIAALVGLADDEPTDGGVLREGLEGGPDEEQVEMSPPHLPHAGPRRALPGGDPHERGQGAGPALRGQELEPRP